jgi:diadenosine tetraphosphatase ApaH/serine/threonine PP2A family protein phosphatase
VRRLILSDIHANLEALEAVLADAREDYQEVVCCGDVVGYNANPVEVIEWVRHHATYVVRGNHDKGCAGLTEMGDFNPPARDAALWTREQLEPQDLKWLRELPAGPVRGEGFEIAHGSPADEDEYLISSGSAEPMSQFMERPICFAGHTHVQGGWSWERGGLLPLSRPGMSETERVIDLDPEYLYLINPGSVGQPRDRDPRAGYAIWDDETRLLHFRRVRYDIREAQSRILEAGLPGILAERLASGR